MAQKAPKIDRNKTRRQPLIILIILFSLILVLMISVSGSTILKTRRIAVLIREDFRGEISFAHRIKDACHNLSWHADLFDILQFKDFKKHSYDLVINLVPGRLKFRSGKYYLAIFHPLHHYFGSDGSLVKPYRNYDGYLLTYSPEKGDLNFGDGKRMYMPWYPLVQLREYRESDPQTLFYVACLWGNRFEDPKMQKVLKLLDQESFTRIYGNPMIKAICPQKYCHSIAYDSKSLCDTANQNGISLILHSDVHNAQGLPSGRIFEAAAASTTIICDNNAFVKKHFGDSVLYINTDVSAESICDQIKQHMDWIHSNKEEARAKARRAHTIYKKSFSLEDQLMRLGAFHDQISKNFFSKWMSKVFSYVVPFVMTQPSDPVLLSITPNTHSQYSLLNSVAFHPEQNIFCVTYTHNNQVILYEMDGQQPRPIQTLSNPTAQLSEPQHAVFSPDGNQIIVANWTNQTFTIYARADHGLYSQTPAAIINPISKLFSCKPHGIAFSPSGEYLAVAYGASKKYRRAIGLFKYEKNRLQCLDLLENVIGTPKGITFTPDELHILVSFCEPDSLAVFSIQNGRIDPQPLQRIFGMETQLFRPEDVKISPDGSCCAVSNSEGNTVTFYHLHEQTLSNTPFYSLRNPEIIFPHGIDFSSDGSYLAITQFGKISITPQGDISWDHTIYPNQGSICLFSLGSAFNNQQK